MTVLSFKDDILSIYKILEIIAIAVTTYAVIMFFVGCIILAAYVFEESIIVGALALIFVFTFLIYRFFIWKEHK